MYKQSVCSLIVVAALALTATQTQGSPYDRVAYWDSGYATSWAGDGIAVRDALQAAGYTVVNAAELKTWMDARIADGKPSVVIFCRDDAPITVVETQDANCTLRKYLNAGGKIVWYGDIPFYYQAKSDGTTTNWGDGGSAAILGFNAAGGTRDVNGQVTFTEAGIRWGLTKPWTSSRPASATATDNLEILATDKNGAACGWVKHYVVGDTCRGFVRIDDHSGTTVSVEQLMAVAEYFEAHNSAAAPVPENGKTEILRDAVFSWTAGSSAATHDVYLGTSFDDVNDATTSDPRGVLVSQGQTDTAFDPEGLFEYGQTYYWRVDEVNDAPDYTVFKGEIWSFTTETYAYPIAGVTAAASIEQATSPASNTVDGSGLDDLDQHDADLKTMWVTPGGLPAWIQYTFDKVYKLHELWVWNGNSELELLMGFGAKDVVIEYSTDGETWTALENVPQFSQGTGKTTYTANTVVDFGEVMAKYVKLTVNTSWGPTGIVSLSEVRFFYTPVQAFEPDPTDGATGIDLGATLNWRPGREATSHQVYFGADADAVAAGTAAAKTVADHSYTPASMDLETVYYWKVDEAGDAGTYAGDVWSFTTQEFLVVDDFESYTDDMDAEEAVFQTWSDGYEDDTNGSIVGLQDSIDGTFCETTIVHGGDRSMPVFYDNSGAAAYAEAKRTFDPEQDWSARGIQSLSLYFRGVAGNTGQLYVKINNTKIVYDGPAINIVRPAWQLWNIDLSAAGNISRVRSLAVGVDGAGAAGTLYIDDIRLYAKVLDDSSPDVTGAGDTVQGVPNDGDWPAAEYPDLAIDDSVTTKYLHFKGGAMATGFRVAPLVGSTIVTGLTFTTANDAPTRDPVKFELSGSNESIDGPYQVIATGDIVDFAGATEWPRFTKNTTPIEFGNTVAYKFYQIVFPDLRGATEKLMQIAEVEFIGTTAP
jgi:hypothetical protein